MSKHHRISHCDSEHTMKIEKEKMAEVRKEEEKMAHKPKSQSMLCKDRDKFIK